MLTDKDRELYYSRRPAVVRRARLHRWIAGIYLSYVISFFVLFIVFNNF